MELINALGIDWKILLAQLINFALIFFVLKKFAWKPILVFLEKRQKEIESGLTKTQEAQVMLAQSEVDKEKVLAKAREEADKIIKNSRAEAKMLIEEAKKTATAQAAVIIDEGERKIKAEKQQIMAEAETKLAGLIARGIEKVIAVKVDNAEIEKIYLSKGIKEVESA
jgi:F-type H+-transporting ATPase subunit b